MSALEKALGTIERGTDWLSVGDFSAAESGQVEKSYLPAGVSIGESNYSFAKLIDNQCRKLIITGYNFADVLGKPGDPPSQFHALIIGALKGAHKPRVTLVFAPPPLLELFHEDALRDLKNNGLPRLVELYWSNELVDDERQRLEIISHVGVCGLPAFIRDPDPDHDRRRGIIVVTPRWATDRQGGSRMWYAVQRSDDPDIFGALYNAIASDLRNHRSRTSLGDVCKQLGIPFEKAPL